MVTLPKDAPGAQYVRCVRPDYGRKRARSAQLQQIDPIFTRSIDKRTPSRMPDHRTRPERRDRSRGRRRHRSSKLTLRRDRRPQRVHERTWMVISKALSDTKTLVTIISPTDAATAERRPCHRGLHPIESTRRLSSQLLARSGPPTPVDEQRQSGGLSPSRDPGPLHPSGTGNAPPS